MAHNIFKLHMTFIIKVVSLQASPSNTTIISKIVKLSLKGHHYFGTAA